VVALFDDERDSFLRRVNPLTKLGFAVVAILVLTGIVDPVTPLVLTVLLLLTVATFGRVPVGDLLRLIAPVWLLSLGLLWTTAFFYVADPATQPRVVWTLGRIAVSDQAIAYALTVFFRIQGFFAASLVFVLTTDPTELVEALVQQLHLSYRFGYGAHAAYRFVPALQDDLTTIRAAHRIRGADLERGPVALARQYVGYLVPLLVGGIRKAERVALAMDARGFGAYPDRTYYHESRFGPSDIMFVVGALVMVGGTLWALHSIGLLGRLVPPFVGG
jgi:energy-coupling factor transport system permease protein